MNFGFKSVCQKNNVVWFYPTDDPNGAFDINRNVCHRLMLWSRTACSVQVRRIARVEEAVAYLGGLPPDSVRHVVLGGHGTGTALAWGPGSQLVGVEELEWARPFGRSYSIPRGRVVRVEKTLQTFAWRMVFPGDTGYVEKVDSDGDARVYFDGLAGVQWVRGSDFAHCQVVAAPMSDLLGGLRRVLQRHGSIFMDSCLSATDEASPNLAEYVAENVGKGVRVIGSRLSFGAVHMARASAWHASIDVASEKQVQRVYVNAEARCPLSARGKRPGSDGNCQCPRGSKCRTKAGKPCPAAGGLFSDVNFLPFCVEDWANDQCECSLAARSPETRSPETTSPEPRSPEAKGLAARSAQLGLLGLALLAATWQC